MKSTKIILFGSSGMVGSRIVELLSETFEIVMPLRRDVDLTKDFEIENFLAKNRADYIIYAAGITKQDQAEDEKELALRLNASVPKLIAQIASKNSTPLIYFSTDAVFDGNMSERPYLEEDQINPVNYYGLTKVYGEEEVLKGSNRNLILRLISVYSAHYEKKVDFARRALAKLLMKEAHEGITDLYFNPTYSDDAVASVKSAINKKATGIYHIGSRDVISNYEFMVDLANVFSIDKNLVKPVIFKDFFKKTQAKRGQYTWLDTSKAQRFFGKEVLHTNIDNLKKFKKEFISR